MSFFSMKYFKIKSLLLLYMHRFKIIYSGLSFSLLEVTLSVLVQPTEAFMNLNSVISRSAISAPLSSNLISMYSLQSPSVTSKVVKGQSPSARHQDIRPVWSQLISHYFSVTVQPATPISQYCPHFTGFNERHVRLSNDLLESRHSTSVSLPQSQKLNKKRLVEFICIQSMLITLTACSRTLLAADWERQNYYTFSNVGIKMHATNKNSFFPTLLGDVLWSRDQSGPKKTFWN